MTTSRYLTANRDLWNQWTPINVRSDFYDVEGFKAGRHDLDPVVLSGVGNVQGKSLLHVQCHFEMDTLSWARRGASVTGVDFSEQAIAAARNLAKELALDATFVQSDLYDAPQALKGEFDVVFTSHGVLGWLPDIQGWANVIAHFLKPDGTFFIAEVHPFVLLFDETRTDTELRLKFPYFHREQPMEFLEKGCYADPKADIETTAYYWVHSIADIIGSLLRAGLTLQAFEEYPFMEWANFPWMEQNQDGSWMLPDDDVEIPLMFSLKATK